MQNQNNCDRLKFTKLYVKTHLINRQVKCENGKQIDNCQRREMHIENKNDKPDDKHNPCSNDRSKCCEFAES